MLSPSRLFFGMPDPAEPDLPLEDEKSVWSCGVFELLQDSDAEEQTDVPPEHSRETSLNESEEERRYPPGEPRRPTEHRVATGFKNAVELSDHLPPGLPLIVGGSGGELCSSIQDGENSADEEDADDERSHLSGELGNEEQPLAQADGIWYSELPSIGSANHFSGTCDRCCFHPKGRCLNGFNCQHCHFDHEKRKRKNKNRNKAKPLQLLSCGEEATDMLSTSAEGSMPVSPDGAFGPGLLPQVAGDFPTPQPTAGSAPEPCGGAAGPAAPGLSLDLPHSLTWYHQAGTLPSQLCGGAVATAPPPFQEAPGYAGQAAPAFDFLCQQAPGSACQPAGPVTYHARVDPEEARAVRGHEREEYIRQLEDENRYLRACLMQCMGPAAAGAVMQPFAHHQQQQQQQQQHQPAQPPPLAVFHPLDGMPLAPVPLPEAGVDNVVAATDRHQAFGGSTFPPPPPHPGVPPPAPPGAPPLLAAAAPSQGLSPSAAPFWPGSQAWRDTSDLDVCRYGVAQSTACASLRGEQYSSDCTPGNQAQGRPDIIGAGALEPRVHRCQ
mmetsp:Transcript_56685/g.159932  ORF Transcript_56685/g.159932 Transcript_56685/m.159932 type:complete len:552 (-) Transcript_56685:44-1699(-)